MLKLQKGYWGSNVETLGIQEYRGFHICVSNQDMDMPTDNGPYCIGLYKDVDNEYELVDSLYSDNYNEEVCLKEIEQLISFNSK